MEQPRAYFLYRSTILLMQMLQLLAEDFLCIKRVDGALPGTFVIYRKIVRFLNETYCSDLSREAFESSFDQTREYLCQIFKKYAGIPMLTYVHRLRIQRAKELLQTTGKPVSEIAREVGFQDPYYFSKVFKRLANETPSRYRSPNPKSEIRI
jgi:AraC-like DNA-binding protein